MKKDSNKLSKKSSAFKARSAFSLIELSIVILIIGIVIAGIIGGNYLYNKTILSSARSLTQSSNLRTFRELYLWLETASDSSLNENDRSDGAGITAWNNISNSNAPVISVGSVKPTYVAVGASGVPAISFSGDNSCYVSTDGSFLNGTNFSILVSTKPLSVNGVTTGGTILTSGGTTPNFSLEITSNGTAVQLKIGGVPILTGSISGYVNIPMLIMVTLSDSVANMYINKIPVATYNNPPKLAIVSPWTLYVGRGYTGQISELAILLK